MKILVITQKVDRDDAVLGFFHRWVAEFAKNFEYVTVVCLQKGQYQLPANVKILSLGKEMIGTGERPSRLKYIFNFYKYIWQERKNYDAVFVHMNQEYVILGWKFWKLFGKKIYLWRNHLKGNLLTRFAVLVSNKVFCTSPSSYTAKFKKTIIMPAGIDTDFFKPDPAVVKIPNSYLFLGRIAPVKRVSEFVDWLRKMQLEGKKFSVTIAGDALPKDCSYEKFVRDKITEYGLNDQVRFIGAVTQSEAVKLYQSHEVYVNLTPAGSMDKTILEAAACGLNLIIDNADIKDNLAEKKGAELRDFVVKNHSLVALMEKLKTEL